MSDQRSLSADDVEAMLASVSFGAYATSKGRPQVPIAELITDYGPLTAEHVAMAEAHAASGHVLGVPTLVAKTLRHTHHRLAQLLAGGMDETVAAKLCNYSNSYVSILKANPAFIELIEHYKGVVDDEFADFASAAANLSMDMLGALQDMLNTSPEKFGPGHLMDAIKLLADRTGHAPVNKTHNVNVNVNLGDRLRAARERANDLLLRDITPRGA